MKLRNLLIAAAGLAVVAGAASTAAASGYYHHGHYYHHYYQGQHRLQNEWQRNHPLRAQVNGRLQTLNKSITKEQREGDIGQYRAHLLRQDLKRIRAQERTVAARKGAHLGYAAQARLNREENNVRHHIPG